MEPDFESQLPARGRMEPEAGWSALRRPLPVIAALLAGLLLRLWMLKAYLLVNGDSLIYGGLAKNLLLHGRYALEGANGELYPTLIRLPGYPLLLAACFRVFGMENYAAAAWVQIPLELAGCLLLADFVRRAAPQKIRHGAALATLWMAALCPFTAVYAVQPMAEGPTLFAIALALWAAQRFRERAAWPSALGFTFAVVLAALLRPDGALVGMVLSPALLTGAWKQQGASAGKLARMGVACLLLALAPFAVWTARNWRVFHVFEPLAPRYANEPGESTYPGFQRWVKSWCLDFVSTYDIYWNMPDGPLDVLELPSRAYDSPGAYDETVRLAADYNQGQKITPALDARFERLAEQSRAAHPLRFHVGLPLGRMADMWLRPRVENLPVDLDWWDYRHHRWETIFSWAWAGLNAAYLLLALAGLRTRPQLALWMVAYLLLRSALLTTIEAPEARYTLECFPMLFVLGGMGMMGGWRRVFGGRR